MNYMHVFEFWKQNKFFDMDTREELATLDIEKDKKEIEDRFYRDLEFGTGGLRGIMGAGTNRINKYTIGKATAGLGKYLIDTYGTSVCSERGVVIGYDTRNKSEYFSRIAANVMSAMGIKVYLYSHARPTPQVSFSVKYYDAIAGIVVTASHNPKEYNGYKVYDEFGCQLVPHQAKKVISCVDSINDYRDIDFNGNSLLIEMTDTTDSFISAVLKQKRIDNPDIKANLHVVYTPLHGTGNVPVPKTLYLDGFENVYAVEQQVKSDGNFSTVDSPNPEDRRALLLGIQQAERIGADIVIGTDPDCDRVGVAVRTEYGYPLLSGNQIGALLMDFILNNTDLSTYKKPAVVKTVVTSELGAEIARKKGLTVFSTLTGFKFIGEKINQFELAKQIGDADRDFDFIMGYEESYGYLIGTHARDKDAVVSSLMICEMTAKLKAMNKTLVDRINEIYTEFGFYHDAMDSFTLKGKDGLEKIASMMTKLRSNTTPFVNTKKVFDYSIPVDAEPGFGTLPMSDVLKYILEDGSWIAIRPSGTEPKIKIYYSIKGSNAIEAKERFNAVQTIIKSHLGL
ncbi:phospho-sugar mutase [Jeotgalibaca porci]|uniref:phospho-sugar mutase n=1 Tax=Jeotgalibaca porci TaxID=1868793 RepID=UPI003F8E666C